MEKQYWVQREGKITGPFSGHQLKQMAVIGMILDSDMISADQIDWQVAGQIKGLFQTEQPTEGGGPGGLTPLVFVEDDRTDIINLQPLQPRCASGAQPKPQMPPDTLKTEVGCLQPPAIRSSMITVPQVPPVHTDQPSPEIITFPKGKQKLPDMIELDCGSDVVMTCKLIPAGTFLMGSPKTEKNRERNEGPQHKVTLSRPFYMGIYPVTQAQYKAVMRKNPSCFRWFTAPDRPVDSVTCHDAAVFCKELSSMTNRRISIPTEAQWEYACRAGSTTRFSFGDSGHSLSAYGWSRKNSGRKTHPVGQKKPNMWGLYDMHGNVCEWCGDYWHKTYENAPTDGSPWAGTKRHGVVRGGSCLRYPSGCRSASRDGLCPDSNSDYDWSDFVVGFRVVVSVFTSIT